ncbi:unnamed protein product, partial [Porites evermanni]
MEWTEVHILVFAKEARVSEPWIYKPLTAKRGKTVPEHFNMMLEKFKANGPRCSGVNVKDSKLDVLMKKGWIFLSSPGKEAETKDVCFTNKQRAEADHAAGEETRKRACRGPRETKK